MRYRRQGSGIRSLVLFAVGAALGGCSSQVAAGGGATLDASVTGTSASTSASSGPSSSTSASAAVCVPHDITITLGRVGAGGGHVGGAILFTNHGSHACEISGYPRVVAAGGLSVEIRQTPNGYLGGLSSPTVTPPHVLLAPGQSASAMAEGSDNPVPATAHCPGPVGSLDVWLPGKASTGARTEIPNPAGICSAIQIHPVIAGSTGRQ